MGERRFSLVVFCIAMLIAIAIVTVGIDRQQERDFQRQIELVRLAERGTGG